MWHLQAYLCIGAAYLMLSFALVFYGYVKTVNVNKTNVFGMNRHSIKPIHSALCHAALRHGCFSSISAAEVAWKGAVTSPCSCRVCFVVRYTTELMYACTFCI